MREGIDGIRQKFAEEKARREAERVRQEKQRDIQRQEAMRERERVREAKEREIQQAMKDRQTARDNQKPKSRGMGMGR